MRNISHKAATLIGSEIIKQGNEINRKISEGNSIYNLTIGDFNPEIFPIPEKLKDYIIEAYNKGQTNYPPPDGMPVLKQAVVKYLFEHENLKIAENEVLIASGGRPLIYAIFQAIVDPGDKVLYPVPSWNNNHYCQLSDAQSIEVHTSPEHGFMPTAEMLAPHLSEVVLLALCSPLNPTGTTFKKNELEEICDLVLLENKKREGIKKPLYVLFDQMYWRLMADGFEHMNPVSLRPEMKSYTLFVDGISKSLAATGVRVGWGVGPVEVIEKMKNFIAHIGAWAPRAEQIATGNFLNNESAMNDYLANLKQKINLRFDGLYKGISGLAQKGFPVQIIKPEGAIYLSVRFNIIGKHKQDGTQIKSTQDITDFLLNRAQLAIVPFTSFGCETGTDWYRISVGTLKLEDIPELINKLEVALSELVA